MADTLAEAFSRHKKPSPAQLKSIVIEIQKLQKNRPDVMDQGYHDRLQRASSWLAKAKQVDGDTEGTFIFLWIALDALCSMRPDVLRTEWWMRQEQSLPMANQRRSDNKSPTELEWFLWRICGLDIDGRVLKGLIEDQWRDVETVLKARYIMSDYWKWKSVESLEKQIQLSLRIVKDAIGLGANKTRTHQALCEIIIRRLRILRNQLFHGSATDVHSKRRAAGESELEAGSRLLEELIWVFMGLMVGEPHHTRYWPPIHYPRAGSAQHKRFEVSWLPKE